MHGNLPAWCFHCDSVGYWEKPSPTKSNKVQRILWQQTPAENQKSAGELVCWLPAVVWGFSLVICTLFCSLHLLSLFLPSFVIIWWLSRHRSAFYILVCVLSLLQLHHVSDLLLVVSCSRFVLCLADASSVLLLQSKLHIIQCQSRQKFLSFFCPLRKTDAHYWQKKHFLL